jgi:hypothetical protein
MLAMKENVRVGFDFSQRILHGTETSRGYAAAKRKLQIPMAKARGKHQPSNVHKIGKCVRLCFDFWILELPWDLEPGVWDFGRAPSWPA